MIVRARASSTPRLRGYMASMASYPDGDVCSMAWRGKKTLAAIRVQRQQRPVLAQRVGLARAAARQDGLREVVDGVADDRRDAVVERRELGTPQSAERPRRAVDGRLVRPARRVR